jgi:acyl transferase domain-containing protein
VAVNAPQLCVVAGPTPVIAAFGDRLSADGVSCRLLHTSHAFHSAMMDPVVEPFLRKVETVGLSVPKIPFVSTVTGDWVTPTDVTDPSYWARHLRCSVQFSKAVQVLLADRQQVLIECGPRRTCVALALQHRPANPNRVVPVMPDSGDPDGEYSSVLLALGSLWLNGCNIDWPAFHHGETRRRVALPTYSFQRRRYWIEPGGAVAAKATVVESAIAKVASPLETDDRSETRPAGRAGDGLTETLVGYLEELFGGAIESFDEDARFIALGLDSLLLTQLARTVRVRLGFEVTFRDLTERYSSTRLLGNAIRARQAVVVAAPPAAPAKPSVSGAQGRLEGARLGRDERGRPAWFVPDPNRPGKYIQVPR